jgi:sulfite reductase alpha subunit-like flavoprotein
LIDRVEDRAELLKLGTDFSAYNLWRVKEPGIVELFKQFPSLRVDSAELAFRLLPLLPRFYSIASSPRYRIGLNKEIIHAKPGTTFLDLLVTVVEYDTPGINFSSLINTVKM